MANPWGSGQYGIGEFGTGLENVDVTLGSFAMSASAGNLGTEGEVNTGWGRLTWSAQAWGIAGTLVAEGVEATVAIGSASSSVSIDVIPNSLSLSTDSGNVTLDIAVEVFQDGFPLTIAEGNLDADPDANITGIPLTTNLGSPLAYNLEGWGRYVWGEYVWGATGIWANVDLTGIELTSTAGNLDINGDASLTLTGNSLSIAEGSLDANPDANPVGIPLTASLTAVFAFTDVDVDVTGIELTANLGSIAEVNGTAVVDINDPTDAFSLLAQEGYIDANPDANPVGVAMTAALSSVTTLADANVDLTGFAITSSLGTAELTPSKEVDLSGFALTMALNSVDYDADGFVELTGNSLTISEGRVYNLIWNEVDTGTVVPWTEVDTAA